MVPILFEECIGCKFYKEYNKELYCIKSKYLYCKHRDGGKKMVGFILVVCNACLRRYRKFSREDVKTCIHCGSDNTSIVRGE